MSRPTHSALQLNILWHFIWTYSTRCQNSSRTSGDALFADRCAGNVLDCWTMHSMSHVLSWYVLSCSIHVVHQTLYVLCVGWGVWHLRVLESNLGSGGRSAAASGAVRGLSCASVYRSALLWVVLPVVWKCCGDWREKRCEVKKEVGFFIVRVAFGCVCTICLN